MAKKKIYDTDPEFFSLFSFPLIRRNPADVLKARPAKCLQKQQPGNILFFSKFDCCIKENNTSLQSQKQKDALNSITY